MNIPEWTKPAIYGAVVGAGALAIVGFNWGGWVTGSNAERMAENEAYQRVAAALAPVCLKQSQADPEREAKIAHIQSISSYMRREAVMEAGWATVPGSESPNRAVAEDCVDLLELDAS